MQAEALDAALRELHAGQAPVPPQDEIFVGDGDYLKIGAEYLRYFVEVGGLKPDDTVLDLGSGIGRMASGLSRYLSAERGRYIGFDPVRAGVDWCRKAYAEHSNFRFEWADLYNELYRPEGKILALDYRFPCEDHSVDFAIATSVFTHLYEPEIAAYLDELTRVLKPGGRLFATAYVFDGEVPSRGRAPHLNFDTADSDHPYRWHVDGMPPLSAVCYSKAYFEWLFEKRLRRIPDIRKGRWQGGDGPWFQDLVLA